jgi:hypothetical protein
MTAQAPATQIEVAAYTIPTVAPEADGTTAWDSTTMVAVHAGAKVGFGYTYASAVAIARETPQKPLVEPENLLDAKIVDATPDALELGVRVGMTSREAVEILLAASAKAA